MTKHARKPMQTAPCESQSCAAISADIGVIESIFEPPTSLVVLQRPMVLEIAQYLRMLSPELRCAETRHCVSLARPDPGHLFRGFPAGKGRKALVDDYLWQLELFSVVADASEIGVRLATTVEQSCPRFHVDHVQIRQICTWQGPATEWLEHADVDRRFLGSRSGDRSDEESGLLRSGAGVQAMGSFDVGLMKGERWPDNAGRGLVHRSPLPGKTRRVMITFDALA